MHACEHAEKSTAVTHSTGNWFTYHLNRSPSSALPTSSWHNRCYRCCVARLGNQLMQLPLGRFVSIISGHNVMRDGSCDVNVHVLPRFYKIIILIECGYARGLPECYSSGYSHFLRSKVSWLYGKPICSSL